MIETPTRRVIRGDPAKIRIDLIVVANENDSQLL